MRRQRQKFLQENELALKVAKCAFVFKMTDQAIRRMLKISLYKVRKFRMDAESKMLVQPPQPDMDGQARRPVGRPKKGRPEIQENQQEEAKSSTQSHLHPHPHQLI